MFVPKWLLWVMKRCIWCLTDFDAAPPEHTIAESLDGYVVTDKVCAACNHRIGSQLEGAAQGFPLIVTVRKRLGLIKINPPPAPDETVFKRLVAKIALEFLADRQYDLFLEPTFDPWRELVLYGKHADTLLKRITLLDVYATIPGYTPIVEYRNLRHAMVIETIEGRLEVAVHLYRHLLCKVDLGPQDRDVPRDHLVMSILDGASKLFPGENLDSWKHQKIVVPGKKRKRGRKRPEAWFR
jgi:hypothetical protein